MIPIDEQPYPLPNGWQWVTIKDISNRISDGSHNPPKNSGIGIPLLSATNIHDGILDIENATRWITLEQWQSENKRTKIEIDDVLVTIVGTIGRVAVVKTDLKFALQRSVAVIKPKINSYYLAYFLKNPYAQNHMQINAKGTAQKGFYLNSLEEVPIPLPPLDEQQRIVDLLDELFGKLDEAKSLAQAVVDGSKLRRAAILHKAFIGELTKLWRDEHGITLDSWQRCQLGDVCKINPPKISTLNLSDDLEVSFVPMAAVSDIRGEITAPQKKFLREVKRGFTNFAEGDIIFAKITPCMENGKAALVGELVNHIGYGSTEFFVLRCGEKILNHFVYHLVRWKMFRDAAKSVMAGSVGQQRVPKNFLATYSLNLPPLEEQKEIVRVLDDMLYREQRTKDLALKTVERVELLKKSILARAFRGELNID